MRISDWSSDVCSSDLIGQLLVELDRKFVKGSRFREEIIRADDRRVATGVAAADPAALDERDVGETMVLRTIISGREAMPAATDHDRVIIRLGRRVAPRRLPPPLTVPSLPPTRPRSVAPRQDQPSPPQ